MYPLVEGDGQESITFLFNGTEEQICVAVPSLKKPILNYAFKLS